MITRMKRTFFTGALRRVARTAWPDSRGWRRSRVGNCHEPMTVSFPSWTATQAMARPATSSTAKCQPR